MKIALGTTSTTKLEILERTLKQIGLSDFQIVPCKADSEITAQPLGEEATLLGSINRAKNSIKLHPEADIGIGLEGGLPLVRNHYYFVCVATLQTKANATFIGISGKVPLPLEVSSAVKNGKNFGEEIREYREVHNSGKYFTSWIDRLITRDHDFTEAIKNAFLAFQNAKHLS